MHYYAPEIIYRYKAPGILLVIIAFVIASTFTRDTFE